MPRRSSARVSSAVWFCIPPMGSNLTPLPASAEGGGSNTEQSLSTLIRVRSVLLISLASSEEPLAAFGPRPPLHTTLIRFLPRRREDIGGSAASPKERGCSSICTAPTTTPEYGATRKCSGRAVPRVGRERLRLSPYPETGILEKM